MSRATCLLISLLFTYIMTAPYSPTGEYTFDPSIQITEASEGLIRYFLSFMNVAYCYDGEIQGNTCGDYTVPSEWEKVYSGRENEDEKSYNFLVFKSDEYKKVVVTVPGTRDGELMEELLQSGLSKYNSYKIMNYFKDRGDGIREGVRTGLQIALEGTSGYQVIFTGHSLGAAVSTVLALYMHDDGVVTSENAITLVTYGQPKTGNEAFVDRIMEICHKVFRIVRDNDLVVSLASLDIPVLNDSQHLGGKIYINHEMTEYIVCPYEKRSGFAFTECGEKKLPSTKAHNYNSVE